MKIKTILTLLLATILCIGLIAGCTSTADDNASPSASASADTSDAASPDVSESTPTPELYTNMVVEVTAITDNSIDFAVCARLEDGEITDYAIFDASQYDTTSETGSITLDDEMQSKIYKYEEENWQFSDLSGIAVGSKIIIAYNSEDAFEGIVICVAQ